jgi:hypothetical protein
MAASPTLMRALIARVFTPLDDVVEPTNARRKDSAISKMTRAARMSRRILGGYLILVTLMLGYHVLELAGVLRKVH